MRKSRSVPSGYTLLLVDDSPEYLEVTRVLLEHEGHVVLTASNGPDALAILKRDPVDLLLLDYFMPGMTGEEVVAELRKFNPYVQVILQTGYASEQPPRELLQRLAIQGYYDKAEGPEKLLLWTDVGLKSAYNIQLLYKSRQGLRYIVDVTPDLHKIQPLENLLQGILWQLAGLLGAGNSFLAVVQGERPKTPPDGFLAMLHEGTGLVVRAGTGRFAVNTQVEAMVEPDKLEVMRRVLDGEDAENLDSATVVPLRVGDAVLGLIYLDRPAHQNPDFELIQLFANQAAVAVQNARLYEMATIDPLTGVHVRHFFEQWLLREIRTVFRSGQPLAVVVLDVDDMGRINETAGHRVGDQVLSRVGGVLRQTLRATDVCARHGGDEFALILPRTGTEAALLVAGRVLAALEKEGIPSSGRALVPTVRMGITVLPGRDPVALQSKRPRGDSYFRGVLDGVMRVAQAALVKAKAPEGRRISVGPPTPWPGME